MHTYLSKGCVELHHIIFFVHICGSEGTCHCQQTATVVPLDTDNIHQSVDIYWVWE